MASTGASQGAPGDRLERHAASDRPRPGSWRIAEASRRLSLGCAVARLTLFWRSRRAARLALRSQRAVQTSHGGVAHITRGVGRLGGGRDVQRRRIFMGTPGSAAGARRRLKTSLGAARAARTAARGRAALPPRSRHGLRPGRPRGWRGSDHSTWFGASGGLLGIFGSAAPARASDPVSPAGEVCGVQPRGVADYVAWCACASVVIATRTVSALPVPAGSVAAHALSLWVESWFMRESWCARII